MKAARKAQEERRARIPVVKSTIEELLPKLDKLVQATGRAHRAVVDYNAKLESDRRAKCSRAVQAAAAEAPSRQPYIEAREKLEALRAQLTANEGELQRLQTTPVDSDDSPEGRALELLDTGNLEPLKEKADIQKRVRDLIGAGKTISAAITIQTDRVQKIQSAFASEVIQALRPVHQDIVSRIAAGVETAREATAEARSLTAAFGVACGNPDYLPSITFSGITVPYEFQQDSFTFWLRPEARRRVRRLATLAFKTIGASFDLAPLRSKLKEIQRWC